MYKAFHILAQYEAEANHCEKEIMKECSAIKYYSRSKDHSLFIEQACTKAP